MYRQLGFSGSLLSSDFKKLLDLCAELHAIGLVIPPALKEAVKEKFPDSEGDRRLLESLPELAEYARNENVCLMLEPVNRNEIDYLYQLQHAINICKIVNDSGLAITADMFHIPLDCVVNSLKSKRQYI